MDSLRIAIASGLLLLSIPAVAADNPSITIPGPGVVTNPTLAAAGEMVGASTEFLEETNDAVFAVVGNVRTAGCIPPFNPNHCGVEDSSSEAASIAQAIQHYEVGMAEATGDGIVWVMQNVTLVIITKEAEIAAIVIFAQETLEIALGVLNPILDAVLSDVCDGDGPVDLGFNPATDCGPDSFVTWTYEAANSDYQVTRNIVAGQDTHSTCIAIKNFVADRNTMLGSQIDCTNAPNGGLLTGPSGPLNKEDLADYIP